MSLPAALLDNLRRRYAEPHRRYHDLRHVEEMLRWGADLDLAPEQEAAIWFHDTVYDPRAKDNEARSAALAAEGLAAAGWTPDRIDRVRRIVLDTVDHRPRTPESETVLDLDLGRLGEERQAYALHVAAVRAEYAFVTDEQWRTGRAAVLRSFLERERLYFTPWGASREERARGNLRWEIRGLEEPGPSAGD